MHTHGLALAGIIMVLIIGGGAVVSGQSDEEMCVPMGIITIEPPDSVESKRSAVEFPHSLHFKYDCKACHHKWTGTEQIQTCMSSGCHDGSVSPLKTAKSGSDDSLAMMRYYKTAYHQMCIGCHKEIKIKNKELEMSYKKLNQELPKSGPTSCNQCHPTD